MLLCLPRTRSCTQQVHTICRFCFLTKSQNFPKGKNLKGKLICSHGSQQGWSDQRRIWKSVLLLLGGVMGFSGRSQGVLPSLALYSEGSPASHTSLEWPIIQSGCWKLFINIWAMNLTLFYLYTQTWCFNLEWLFQEYNHHINWKKIMFCFGWNFIKTCSQFQKISLLVACHQRYLYCQKTQLSTFVAAVFTVILRISASTGLFYCVFWCSHAWAFT